MTLTPKQLADKCKTEDELIVFNEQLNSCCKDWIEVNEYQQKELVELRKKSAELVKYKNRVDEIIQSFGIQSCINDEVDLKKAVAIRDLEQQAKGIDLALSDYPCMYGDTKVYVADLENRAKDLNEQAKQLKGGAK